MSILLLGCSCGPVILGGARNEAPVDMGEDSAFGVVVGGGPELEEQGDDGDGEQDEPDHDGCLFCGLCLSTMETGGAPWAN